MALIKCPECGQEISDTCDRCIHCGYRLKKENQQYILARRLRIDNEQTMGIVLLVLGIVTAFFLLGIILIIIGVSKLSKGSKESSCHYEIAYYNDGTGKVTFYSPDEDSLVVGAEEITKVRHTEDCELYVTSALSNGEFYCGKCSKAECDRLEDYLNKIKFGEFHGL